MSNHDLFRRAEAAWRAGQLAEAEAVARQLAQQVPGSELGPQLLGLVLASSGQHEAATQALGVAAARAPRKAQIPLQIAEVRLAVNDLDGAIGMCEWAIELRPTFDEAHLLLGRIRARAGRPDLGVLVTAIIPTTGLPVVREALASAVQQQHPAVEILLVADGPEAAAKLPSACGDLLEHPRVRRLDLPHNTGAGGFNGHRVYGAGLFLARGRWVSFLDEDNAWTPDHLGRLVSLVAEGRLDWAYTLRRLITEDGQPIAQDDCDSLGHWPSVAGEGAHVVDTSCYLLRTDLAVRHAPTWYRRYGDLPSPDVAICRALLKERPRYGWTGESTVLYRLRGGPDGEAARRYLDGNAEMTRRYPTGFPWRKKGLSPAAMQALQKG